MRHPAAFLDDIPNNIVLIDIGPQVNTHSFLAVEQLIRHTAYLAENYTSNGPCITVLLQGADIEANRLFDDVVLAIRDQKRPIRQVHHRRHDDDTREEWRVVQQRPGQANQR